MLTEGIITKNTPVYDDPLPYIEPLRAMVWIHELIEVYRDGLTPEIFRDSFKIVTTLVAGFAAYIDKEIPSR